MHKINVIKDKFSLSGVHYSVFINMCWKYKRRSILFKHKDDVIPWLISCIELDQVRMVQIIHDLDLILHHVLPKTQVQTDKCRSRHTDTDADKHRHREHTRTRTRTRWEVSAVLCYETMHLLSSRSNICHLGEKYSLSFCSSVLALY